MVPGRTAPGLDPASAGQETAETVAAVMAGAGDTDTPR